ncbi:MAG: inositol monophosphatase family protein [Bradymonadia bacterium]
MNNHNHRLILNLIKLCKYTRAVQTKGVEALAKPDRTLVSQVDLFVQAAVIHHLSSLSPDTAILAEETVDQILDDPSLTDSLNHHLTELGIQQDARKLIAKGTHAPSQSTYWCLDPIDGTRGFLRGDHYAIALALITNNEIKTSFLGCPNLLGHGVLFHADGSTARAFNLDTGTELPLTNITASGASPILIESLELGPRTENFTQQFKQNLGWLTESIRMDSQSKYGAMALGMAHCYLRLPRSPAAKEYAWDHAAGAHLIQALGGEVSDLDGRRLDFSQGATLSGNRGIIATMGLHHSTIVDQVERTDQALL